MKANTEDIGGLSFTEEEKDYIESVETLSEKLEIKFKDTETFILHCIQRYHEDLIKMKDEH